MRIIRSAAFAVMLLVLAAPAALAQSGDLDCKDFTSSEAATNFIRGTNDPHGLDADDDGIACENHRGPWSRANPPATRDLPGEETGTLANTGPRATQLTIAAAFVIIGGGLLLRTRYRPRHRRT